MSRPCTLIVLDGFGLRAEKQWNAIAQAATPVFDRLFATCSWTALAASGLAVGLPEGQMGNSEVGHLNIGAGRVVDQDLVRISKAASALEENPMFAVLRGAQTLHVVGLLSDGGVHSHIEHIIGAIRAAGRLGIPRIRVHAILDGRDTPPKSALGYLRTLMDALAELPGATLATIVGRYFTMDRDERWERVQRGYDLMVHGKGTLATDPIAAVEAAYAAGQTDEFVEPIVLPGAPIADGDAVLFCNFRADRMRQIVRAFSEENFVGFDRGARPRVVLATMNRYHEAWSLPVLFPPQEVRNHLGSALAAAGLTQLRLAETEKFAHVTFFFNGGSDTRSEGEDREMIPSPKVATYDLAPDMSVALLAQAAVHAIRGRTHDVVIMNIANPDMVGHTGNEQATVSAVEATDAALGVILDAVNETGGIALITADHGNCELMFDAATNQPHTAHTGFPVPLILVGEQLQLREGVLADVAPTMLALLGIPQPPEMTGRNLIVELGE